MNLKLVRIATLALGVGGASSLVVQAQTVPVAIEVTVGKTVKEKHAAAQSGVASGGEDRLLEIELKNSSSQALANLEVKYWLLVRDVKSKEVTIGVSDTSTLTLPPHSQTVVTSAVVKCDFTPHTSTGKSVPAKGNKFYGYGVQVLEGGKIASQTYEPTDGQTVIEEGGKKAK